MEFVENGELFDPGCKKSDPYKLFGYNGLERLMLEHRRMTGPAPKPDWNAVRGAAQRTARDIRIMACVIKLRRLAEATARGELPVPDDDPPKDSDRQ